jgi:hypothetical protein
MFILDSLMIAGIRWTLNTVLTAAEAERDDDTSLREQLLEAEMRREMGEISDEAFKATEADLLARIREIRERREGTGPLAFGSGGPMETSPDRTFQVEAELSGDFHEPLDRPAPAAAPPPSERPAPPASLSARAARTSRASRTSALSRPPGPPGSARKARKPRTTKA